MKKIIYLSILLFLFIPTLVLADAGGPSVIGYEAVVINKKGAKVQYSDENETVPYNTKIYVYNQDEENVTACIGKKSQFDCDDSVTIKKSDIAPVKNEVTPKDFKTSDDDEVTIATNELKILIDNKKGAKLKKGPADVYGSYDKVVPYRTVLTSTNYVNSYGPGGSDYILFIYIDSDGYKGWIDPDDVAIYSKENIIAFDKIELLDDDDKTIDTIPAETVISGYYGSYEKIYIEYNGKQGHAVDAKIAYQSTQGRVLTTKKTSIKSMTGETRGEIPAGELLKILYASPDDIYGDYPYHSTSGYSPNEKDYYFYIEYDGIKGIVSDKDVVSLDYESKEKTVELKEEAVFYDANQPEGKDEETIEEYLSRWNRIGKIPKSGTVTVYTEHEDYDSNSRRILYIQLVRYKDKVGYITRIEKDPNGEPEETPEPSSTTEPIGPTATPNTKADPKEKSDNMILYCIIGGVLLAIAAIGTIIVINKNRKKKETTVDEEVKEEPKSEVEDKHDENVDNNEEQAEETKEEDEKE